MRESEEESAPMRDEVPIRARKQARKPVRAHARGRARDSERVGKKASARPIEVCVAVE